MMAAIVTALAAFIAAGMAVSRQKSSGWSCTTTQRTDLDGISPHIERAAALLDQLRELDDLQTSLELCAPRERAQALQLEWTNHNGSRHAAQVWMDGSGSTGDILTATIREREALRTALLDEIRAAYSAQCVTGTITQTTGKELTEIAG